MRIKRYLCAFAAILMLVSGCGESGTPGRLEQINMAALTEKMNNKEDFMLVITQTGCGHCTTFHNMLNEYLPDHNVIVYEVLLDWKTNKEGAQQALAELNAIFPDFNGTPDLYCMEKGEIKSRFWAEEAYQNEGLSEMTFH